MNGAKMIVGRAFEHSDGGWFVHVKNNPDPAPKHAEGVVKGANGWTYWRPASKVEIAQRLAADAYSHDRHAQFLAEIMTSRAS